MNNKYKLLVVEDEDSILTFVSALLEANGYQVITAQNGSMARSLFSSYMPDLVILDLGLPDMDGVTFLKEIRKSAGTPVIVLSARAFEEDKVEALDQGANDYVTKPFSSPELLARVRACLRSSRPSALPGKLFTLRELIIDYDARRVFLQDTEIHLTQTEYNIFALLSQHCGKVLTYAAISKEIWGYSGEGSIKKLQVNMANIRKKLRDKPGKTNYIINELGVGYRLNDEGSKI